MAQKDWIPVANAGAPPVLGALALLLPWWVTADSLAVQDTVRHYVFGAAASALEGRVDFTSVFAVSLLLSLLGFTLSSLSKQPLRAQAVWAGASLGLGVAAALHTALRWPPFGEFQRFVFSGDHIIDVGGAPHLSYATAVPGLGWFLALAAATLPALVLWRTGRFVRS